MQLDKTQIAIRERGLLELFDLSLLVIKRYVWRIVVTTAVLAVPFSLVNTAILWNLRPDLPTEVTTAQYGLLMVILIFLEAPLATSLVTLMLGDVMFHDEPDWRRMMSAPFSLIPRMFWLVAVLRGVVPGMGLVFLCTLENAEAWGFFLFLLVAYATILRGVRPFVGEIILLERNPFYAQDANTMTVGRRSAALHNPNFGDMVIRAMASTFAIPLACAVCINVWALRGYLFGQWGWDSVMLDILLPASLWLVAAFMTVARFLSYLDLRIRREGWEVELVVRAEANRWKGAPA
ncbi:hypothetical protein LOC68_05930 [Blastopirellula sp. JC732]|uniref:Uncharacterized protein n=1 Tax=Blastopirellula sediminis TaxID=2894196 RepID=A0A9X1SFM8_9BACT|nr:hypothetical protein [Blastopirellula sediminis]MCC9609296.1 hypothetical protein [Blastopirellula sediminis]MCC9627927.1 hypothetical protein [Blastopirellula sediminis]